MTRTARDLAADPPARRKLPIGIQTFREIREDGAYYVDKTPFIRRLVEEGKHYFLSRPRRFGKSLLVDTIKELFEGNEPLFRGLAVHDAWDWSARRPVVRFDFSQVAHDIRLRKALLANDFTGLELSFKALFAGIPYQWHTRNDIADYEGCCASVFYSCFAALGMEVAVEDSTSHGRLDMAVVFNDHVYLFEFKVVESVPEGAATPPATALAQLRERGYADKYRASGRPVHLIGVEFSKETRNVAAFEAETA